MTPAEATVIELERRFPDWEVWRVDCYVKPDRWAARRHGQPKAELHARSPEELAEYLAEASGAGK